MEWRRRVCGVVGRGARRRVSDDDADADADADAGAIAVEVDDAHVCQCWCGVVRGGAVPVGHDLRQLPSRVVLERRDGDLVRSVPPGIQVPAVILLPDGVWLRLLLFLRRDNLHDMSVWNVLRVANN